MSKRSYDQNCVLARASDVIGERWTMLLLRDLLIAPRRYNALLASLKGIGTNLLAARLKDLEASGILERNSDETGVVHYALTTRGRALEPTVLSLIRWSMMYGPPNKPGDHHQNDWDLLALKAVFHPELADGVATAVQFQSATFRGWVRIQQSEMQIGVGEIDNADVVVNGTVGDVFLGSKELASIVAHGQMGKLKTFMRVFAR